MNATYKRRKCRTPASTGGSFTPVGQTGVRALTARDARLAAAVGIHNVNLAVVVIAITFRVENYLAAVR